MAPVSVPVNERGWQPYRPPWYPDDAPTPFNMNGETGPAARTNYEDWCKSLKPGELRRLIAQHRTEVTA